MELDPDDVFKDEEDDSDEFLQQRETSKEYMVYLVDASPKMFSTTCPSDDQKEETHFHIAVSCIAQSLKTRIINSSYDEVAICFFNTREEKNLQHVPGVYAIELADKVYLDRPTARLVKDVDRIGESFLKEIGSQHRIVSGQENSLYNALWVSQAILRKGSSKTIDKRILLFTNEDDPFGSMKGAAKTDMTRTTLQRAKDTRDLGISIELLPLSRPDKLFNVSLIYNELIGLEADDVDQFMPLVGQKLEDMKDQLRKRMFTKRIVRKITMLIANGISIDLNSYALIRPTTQGAITWLDSVTNRPLKTERSFICADTGALMLEPAKQVQSYKNENIKFSVEELSEVKRVSTGHLRILGFKPLNLLKDYHNLRPSTFLFPSDKELIGSTRIFIALHRSMLRLKRFAVAFYGPRVVALVAQDEIISDGGQVEPPGMHMIFLPYSDDVRHIEEFNSEPNAEVPCANDEQIKNAAALIKRIDLKDFSVCQFANPALQRHYAMLQALALEEDEMPETKDETLPDEEGMSRPGVVKAIEEYKFSVYGDKYDEECSSAADGKASDASRKRKAAAENAGKEYVKYDWAELADGGKLKDMTVADLKIYLTANNLPVGGKKVDLINRILSHMGK